MSLAIAIAQQLKKTSTLCGLCASVRKQEYKMHILFLTDNFPPEVNAPASRTFEHCSRWVNKGHQVTVITCTPNFPQGKVYPGYKNRIIQKEKMAGITVIRVWTYITANKGFFKRILDYISYMTAAILVSPVVRKPDIVVATSPLLFTAFAGYVVGRIKKIPFVFELRDLWPASIKAVGAMENSTVLGILERIEMFLYRKAAKIVSVTQSQKDVLVRRGITAEKIHVVKNGVDPDRFFPMEKDAELEKYYGLTDCFVAGYLGTHGMAHALEIILEAADKCRKTDKGRHIRFLFLGDGARKKALVQIAEKRKLDNVLFIDSVPKSQVRRYWSLLDVSIIHLKKTELFKTVIPSKLFESMGMGIPILHGVAGESADIINHHGTGLVFEPENSDMLCDNLFELNKNSELYEKLKRNCIEAAPAYNRSDMADRMLNILEGLT